MFKKLFIILTLFLFSFSSNIKSKERSIMIMKLKYGEVKIELFDEIAPNHVKRIKALADSEKYDGVAFHRVIDGFMAQTGDVKFGNTISNTPIKVLPNSSFTVKANGTIDTKAIKESALSLANDIIKRKRESLYRTSESISS